MELIDITVILWVGILGFVCGHECARREQKNESNDG